jgi:class 3 adenylate cyclase
VGSTEWTTPEQAWAAVDMSAAADEHKRPRAHRRCADACMYSWRRALRMIHVDKWILLAPFLLLVVCCAIGVMGVLIAADSEATARRLSALGVLTAAATSLKTTLVAASAPAVSFSGVIRANPDWSAVVPFFSRVGQHLAEDVLAQDAVITFVLAPQAVVREIVPPGLPGWEYVYGLDLLRNSTWRPGALTALQRHNLLTATGPMQLRAGPIGVVVRYALWLDGAGPGETWGAPGSSAYDCEVCHTPANASVPSSTFWGFVQLNVDWLRLLSISRVEETLCGPYAARIEYVRPDSGQLTTVFACGGDMPADVRPVSAAVNVMHNQWTLQAAPRSDAWAPVWRTPLLAAVAAISLLLAGMLYAILLRRALHTALLRAILPERVVSALVQGETYTECVSGATVLFIDIVNYTTFASSRRPAELLDVLNDLYRAFDAIALKHGCYKVETVGDAFLVVTGLGGKESAKAAAIRAARFALDITATTPLLRLGSRRERVRIRIGLASGPIVGGVVGFRTPHFCIFGDTVNT